jgi:ATP-dependent exoDNAse (exonuclease V) alpha subunit
MSTDTLDLDNFTLTADQQAAMEAFHTFLLDPIEQVFVLSGYSGCGKSTLVRTLMDRLDGFQKACRLVNPSFQDYVVELTATTNKAAENLAQITGMTVKTIQSFLGLRVEFDARTDTSKLIPRNNFTPPTGVLLFIDEASQVDKELLGHVFSRTSRTKVVFIGDPAQLTPVKSTGTPVFDAGFSGAALTQVVRQAAGNPIVDLSTQFRHTVNTGKWTPFTPDGHHVQRMNRADFNAAIEAEFTRPDWKYSDSKILAWTNKCVVSYNEYVRGLAKGDPHFQAMDYAACNSFVQAGKNSFKTDQLVQITTIEPDSVHQGVLGNWVVLDYATRIFHPKSLAEKKARIREARAIEDFSLIYEIEQSWVDLRGVFAQTLNKAQGSTFGSVFIDLDDVGRCHSGDQIARMLYVGISRARDHVYLTGDLA